MKNLKRAAMDDSRARLLSRHRAIERCDLVVWRRAARSLHLEGGENKSKSQTSVNQGHRLLHKLFKYSQLDTCEDKIFDKTN